MQHLLEIYTHLAEKKSLRFTDKRKAEMLSKQLVDDWEQRATILDEATPEEITELVWATRTHLPLLLALVKKVDSVVVLNALIEDLDIENTRQVLRSLKLMKPPEEDKVDKGEDDDDVTYKEVLNDPPLVTAIMTKGVTIEMIQMLLQEGCDPNSMIANNGNVYKNHHINTNNSSLYCALVQKRNDIVKLLLDNGATVTNEHSIGYGCWSADIIECIDDYAMVELLLKHGADPNSSYSLMIDDFDIPISQGTALIRAIYQGKYTVVKLLLDNGAKVNKETDWFEEYWGNAISFAYSFACGRSSTATWEITKLNLLSNQVYTPWDSIHNPIKRSYERFKIFKLVYENNDPSVDGNYEDCLNIFRDAMLRPNCQEFAQIMLDSDYNINVTELLDHEFETPLLCILMNYDGYRGTTKRRDFLKFCNLNPKLFKEPTRKKLACSEIINNADIYKYCITEDIPSRKVITDLHFSDVLSGVLPQLGQLIKKTKDINASGTSFNLESPLHCAAMNRSPAVVAMLLADERINVNVQNEEGNTPLDSCRHNSYFGLQITDMLLKAKCNVNHQNINGETVLFRICACENLDENEVLMCKRLLKAGADPNIDDGYGNTPVSVVTNAQVALLLFKYGGDGTKVNNPDIKQVYKDYRTRLNDENNTFKTKVVPQFVHRKVQLLNGAHCTRCNKLITGDSREDGDGHMCMECYSKAVRTAAVRTAAKTKETKPLYKQFVK